MFCQRINQHLQELARLRLLRSYFVKCPKFFSRMRRRARTFSPSGNRRRVVLMHWSKRGKLSTYMRFKPRRQSAVKFAEGLPLSFCGLYLEYVVISGCLPVDILSSCWGYPTARMALTFGVAEARILVGWVFGWLGGWCAWLGGRLV